MSKNTIIKGTLILTITGVITRLLGFYNRIFLARLIGVRELGIYQLIYPLYVLAISFCSNGFSVALTKHVSYHIGNKDKKSALRLLKYSIITTLILSLIAYFIIYGLSYEISLKLLKNTECSDLLKIISLAIPFVAVKGCINAYFMGINKPFYHGISHLIEQIIRISTAYILSVLWTADKINSTLAVCAVITGEILASVLAVIIYYFNKKKCIYISENADTQSFDTLYKGYLKDAVPITGTNVMLTLFSSLEAIIMPAMLFYYYKNNDIAMEMYGIITGIVIPFLFFPSTITNSLSSMLLPAVSFAKAQNNSKKIRNALVASFSFCFALGVATTIFYMLFGNWLCVFAFDSSISGIILRKMCILCPLIYISGNMSAILNGLGLAFHNLIFNIASISIRILFTVTLVPTNGIIAYIAGITVSYLVLDIAMIITFRVKGKMKG